MTTPQIIALGGGGFSMEPDNALLDAYVLRATGKAKPKVCFLPQASGESLDYIVRFYSAFSRHECTPSHLSLFRPHTADLEGLLLSQDLIYVGGGNTKSMLALWREWSLDGVLHQAWQQGIVLAGISAGAICWFAQGHTDSIPGPLSALPCLGFLDGSCSPHFDGEVARRPSFHGLIARGQMQSGYAADDGAALHFVGQHLHKVVSSRPNAMAYWIEKEAAEVVEKPLPTSYLGST
jgi:dipeptidase E